MAQESTAHDGKQRKKCSSCGVEKPLDAYRKQAGRKFGRQSQCKECRRKHYEANKERILRAAADWKRSNKEAHLQNAKDWRKANLERDKANHRAKQRRYRQNREYRLVAAMRTGIRRMLINRKGKMRHLPYTVDDLARHLERQFSNGMTWENYGSYWHVDHITPISAFDPSNEEQFSQCWALANLRPLTAAENLAKNARREFLI